MNPLYLGKYETDGFSIGDERVTLDLSAKDGQLCSHHDPSLLCHPCLHLQVAGGRVSATLRPEMVRQASVLEGASSSHFQRLEEEIQTVENDPDELSIVSFQRSINSDWLGHPEVNTKDIQHAYRDYIASQCPERYIAEARKLMTELRTLYCHQVRGAANRVFKDSLDFVRDLQTGWDELTPSLCPAKRINKIGATLSYTSVRYLNSVAPKEATMPLVAIYLNSENETKFLAHIPFLVSAPGRGGRLTVCRGQQKQLSKAVAQTFDVPTINRLKGIFASPVAEQYVCPTDQLRVCELI